MDNVDLNPLFAGANDERLIWALDFKLENPRTYAQRIFHIVCEATALLNCGGFEKLVEQDCSLEEYAAALVVIGMPQVKPIFERVIAMLPAELRSREQEVALFEYLDGHFDELRKLFIDFLQASENIYPVICSYVRNHREEFAEYASG